MGSAPPPDARPARAWYASLWLVALVSFCVIVPRTLLIAHAHNESTDCEYHLKRGLIFLEGVKERLLWNDPPLGEAILALPAYLTAGDRLDPYDERRPIIYTHPLGPERLLLMTAAWKALLLVPLPPVIFVWCREVYGAAAAWLAVALVLVEPTFAAHSAYVTLDMPGVLTIVLACWLGWRYLQAPSRGRLVAAALATSVAMLTKHTAIILPGVLLVYAIVEHALARVRHGQSESNTLRRRLNDWAAAMVLALVLIWPLMRFDVSKPRYATLPLSAEYTEDWSFVTDVINPLLDIKMPAGLYIGSVVEAISHGREGHQTYLFGQSSLFAPWYYQFAVATYKVPIGVAVILLLAIASLVWVRPRAAEWPLLIAAVAWTILIMQSGLGIGFRHFLPAYVFWLMLAARTLAAPVEGDRRRPAWPIAAVCASLLLAAVHVASWHPNFLSYINFPREKEYLAIGDSNLDWGQGLKQARRWLDENPQQRPVYISPFLVNGHLAVSHYVGSDVHLPEQRGELPKGGLFIIGKSHISGQYIRWGGGVLADAEPVAVIGNSMVVFDIDALRADGTIP